MFLDESAIQICIAHASCPSADARADDPCDRRHIYGVGVVVFETTPDEEELRQHLSALQQKVAARNGVANYRRTNGFARKGWHATDDSPEFSEPLLTEVDTAAGFKGHVRYRISKTAAENLEALYDDLFVAAARPLFSRYRSEPIRFIFEESSSSLSHVRGLIRDAGGQADTEVLVQPKGDPLLALADYLIYAALQYIGRQEQLCSSPLCTERHAPPLASQLLFDMHGAPLSSGHVRADDYRHRMYFTFARMVSSAVKVG